MSLITEHQRDLTSSLGVEGVLADLAKIADSGRYQLASGEKLRNANIFRLRTNAGAACGRETCSSVMVSASRPHQQADWMTDPAFKAGLTVRLDGELAELLTSRHSSRCFHTLKEGQRTATWATLNDLFREFWPVHGVGIRDVIARSVREQLGESRLTVGYRGEELTSRPELVVESDFRCCAFHFLGAVLAGDDKLAGNLFCLVRYFTDGIVPLGWKADEKNTLVILTA